MKIQIADVCLSLNSDVSISLENIHPSYRSFVKTKSNINNCDIVMGFDVHSQPDLRNSRKIFESGQAWSLYQNGNRYFIKMHSAFYNKKPMWIAEFNWFFTNGTVYLANILNSRNNKKIAILNPLCYPLDQILLMHFLSLRKGILVHAAGLAYNGKGYIFPGKSGSGKSTLTQQLSLVNNFELLSDDRMILRKIDKRLLAYGTPWPGDAGIAVNKSIPLTGICFLSKSDTNIIEEISQKEAIGRLLPVVSIPWYDKEVIPKILDFCDELISSIPVYVLHFKPGPELVDVFDKFVSN